jgi:uncharacterized protein
MSTRLSEPVRSADVDDLDLASLEPGYRWHLRWKVAEDGIGRARRIPIIVLRGKRPGPRFCVTAALHGNELNGIPVIHRALDAVAISRLRGTIIALPALNVPGMLRTMREFEDGTDLNHIMPGALNSTGAHHWAYRIADLVTSNADRLIDLHTASSGRINSLYVRADLEDEHTARMAMLQRPSIILHNPPSDRTLRGAAAEQGIPAITVEVGDPNRFQARHIRPTIGGLRAVMADLGMVGAKQRVPCPPPVICRSSAWLYTDRGGLLDGLPDINEIVEEGQVIGRQVDAYGDVVREYHAPHRGIVIGRSVNPVAPTGARLLHLGVLARPTDTWAARATQSMEPIVAQKR